MTMRSRDLGFRVATGLFGAVVIGLVVAIGFRLTRQSTLTIQKFGLSFWRTQTWDPLAGEFGALPFIWGTRTRRFSHSFCRRRLRSALRSSSPSCVRLDFEGR